MAKFKAIYVPKNKAPKGYECGACGKTLKPDQVAMYAERRAKGIDQKFIFAYHRSCFAEFLNLDPVEIYDSEADLMLEFLRIKTELSKGNVDA